MGLGCEGTLHQYMERQVAFEFAPVGKKKVLIFVGGLGDGLLTVPYVEGLSKKLEPLGFSVIQIQFSSSYHGFGTGSLDRDVAEIDQLVDYLKKNGRSTIVLMGHSTGSQDTMHYLLKHQEKIQGGIMQAPVSDRQSSEKDSGDPTFKALNAEAKALLDAGKTDELLSHKHAEWFFDTPMSVYRWCSLILPGGDDDYFSSDLPDANLESSFGKLRKPFLVAYSEKDEFVPEFVNKLELLERWKSFTEASFWSSQTGLIRGASHNVAQPDSQEYLFEMIAAFISEFDL